MTYIVGKTDTEYDSDRLRKSITETAVANRTPHGTAEQFAQEVVKRIEAWVGNKTEVTPTELRLHASAVLAEYDPEAAYLYENEDKLF